VDQFNDSLAARRRVGLPGPARTAGCSVTMGHLCSNERGPPAFMGRPSPQGVKKGLGLAPIFIWFGIMKRSAPLSSGIIRTSAALCHHPSAADTLGRHVKPPVDRPNAPQPPCARPQIEQGGRGASELAGIAVPTCSADDLDEPGFCREIPLKQFTRDGAKDDDKNGGAAAQIRQGRKRRQCSAPERDFECIAAQL
jgi:hypothetical protein